MAHSTTPSLGMQDYFTTTLSSQVNVGDTVINLNAVPTASEGYLVIDPNNASTREVIYYSSKTSSTVICPDATQGSSRGLGGTTAQSHAAGVAVEMRMVAEYWNAIQSGQSWAVGSIGATAFASGWAPGLATPNTVTYNGNRSYTMAWNGTDLTPTISNGMRLKLTRTATAPTQCTSLNGTTQYFSNASPAGMTFTTTCTTSAWVKLTQYGATSMIMGRHNGTNGFLYFVNSSGQLNFQVATGSASLTYQSIPLNKWVHVAASYNAGTVVHYIDGVLVPSSGTPSASIIQAGSFQIGAYNGATNPFPGKIAQAAVFSAVIAQATIQSYISQGLAGTETSLISAYSFNNSINDLNANANNLTANGSAVATNADSPFAGGANASTAYTAGTTEFGEVFNISFSTNTTVTVQVPDGYAIPTSGGVSAVSYSTQSSPLGWPLPAGIKEIGYVYANGTLTNSTGGDVLGATVTVYVPAGRRVRLKAIMPFFGQSNLNLTAAQILEGATTVANRSLTFLPTNSASIGVMALAEDIISPSAGSHTYKVTAVASTANTNVGAGTILIAELV